MLSNASPIYILSFRGSYECVRKRIKHVEEVDMGNVTLAIVITDLIRSYRSV